MGRTVGRSHTKGLRRGGTDLIEASQSRFQVLFGHRVEASLAAPGVELWTRVGRFGQWAFLRGATVLWGVGW